jgi:hypothetical protein
MQQTEVIDEGDGILLFKYVWHSTTGEEADLVNCSIREKVDYPGGDPYCWPRPPWYQCHKNPVLSDTPVPAIRGELWDEHGHGNLFPPYQVATFTATQVYQYHCDPDCCMGPYQWDTLLEIGPIMRFVTGEGDLWRYSIIKSGVYAEWFPLP